MEIESGMVVKDLEKQALEGFWLHKLLQPQTSD